MSDATEARAIAELLRRAANAIDDLCSRLDGQPSSGAAVLVADVIRHTAIYQWCYRNGFSTLGQVAASKPESLIYTKGFGIASKRRILATLTKHGLACPDHLHPAKHQSPPSQ